MDAVAGTAAILAVLSESDLKVIKLLPRASVVLSPSIKRFLTATLPATDFVLPPETVIL